MLDQAQKVEETDGVAVVEILQRLWQTKMQNIRVIEQWLGETRDSEIQVGLTGQLIDERRHLRLIGEQIRRLGGRIEHGLRGDTVSHVFADIVATKSDLMRLLAFYRGVKAYSAERCSHLIPLLDDTVGAALTRIVLDEERHVRWADLRIHRLLTRETMREANFFLDRIRKSLESNWGRSLRHLSLAVSQRRVA